MRPIRTSLRRQLTVFGMAATAAVATSPALSSSQAAAVSGFQMQMTFSSPPAGVTAPFDVTASQFPGAQLSPGARLTIMECSQSIPAPSSEPELNYRAISIEYCNLGMSATANSHGTIAPLTISVAAGQLVGQTAVRCGQTWEHPEASNNCFVAVAELSTDGYAYEYVSNRGHLFNPLEAPTQDGVSASVNLSQGDTVTVRAKPGSFPAGHTVWAMQCSNDVALVPPGGSLADLCNMADPHPASATGAPGSAAVYHSNADGSVWPLPVTISEGAVGTLPGARCRPSSARWAVTNSCSLVLYDVDGGTYMRFDVVFKPKNPYITGSGVSVPAQSFPSGETVQLCAAKLGSPPLCKWQGAGVDGAVSVQVAAEELQAGGLAPGDGVFLWAESAHGKTDLVPTRIPG